MSEPTAVGPVAGDVLGLLEEEEWENAERHFFGALRPTKGFGHNNDEMMFEEWVLFEWKDAKGSLALERAVGSPSLSSYQKSYCRSLLDSQHFSYWRVVEIQQGYGFTIEDLYTGKTYKIRFPRLSQELAVDDIFAARVAMIDGRWLIASGSVETLPIVLDVASRQSFFSERPEHFGIQSVYNLKGARRTDSKDIELTTEQASRLVTKNIQKAGLARYISVNTVRSWINSDLSRTPAERAQKPQVPLTISLLSGLAYGTSASQLDDLMQSIIQLQGAVAKGFRRTQPDSHEEKQKLFVFETDPDSWREEFEDARELAHEGDQVAALKRYEEAFANLHQHQSTYPDIFRFVYNAAMSALYSGNEPLAKRLVEASLALNPAYDMALAMKRKAEDGELGAISSRATLLRVLEEFQALKRPGRGVWLSNEQTKEHKRKSQALLKPARRIVPKNHPILALPCSHYTGH